jgi:hypothetical protein
MMRRKVVWHISDVRKVVMAVVLEVVEVRRSSMIRMSGTSSQGRSLRDQKDSVDNQDLTASTRFKYIA